MVDTALTGEPEEQIVGTYRLLRQEVAMANGGFTPPANMTLRRFWAAHPQKRFMELGRSCVLPHYRNQAHGGVHVARQLGLCAAP